VHTNHPVTRLAFGLAVVVMAAMASACATGRAQIPEPQPTLVVPPVPPRTIEPLPVATPEPEPPVTDPPPPPPPAPKPRPRPSTDPKPDPKETPPVEATSPPPNPPPVAPLRTPTTPAGPEAIVQIRDIIDTTQKMLDKVDSLGSDDRKANFATARSLLQQADEALKKDDLTQARSAAERALNIAKVLLSSR
jgi:outer membrane biosynthesis protein TonB